MTIAPMPDEDFWALIDETAPAEPDLDARGDLLRTALEKRDPDAVLSFIAALYRKIDAAYDWGVWGAAYVANGGCSDDGFEYFRRWLVSRGRETFEAVLADPDSLADHVGNEGDIFEFEEFPYVAYRVWEAKTGTPFADSPDLDVTPIDDPTGEPFVEDAAALALRYPKLTRRFG